MNAAELATGDRVHWVTRDVDATVARVLYYGDVVIEVDGDPIPITTRACYLVPAEPEQCRWYAMCDNPSIGVVRHPVLDPVPTCQRCATKHSLVFMERGSCDVEYDARKVHPDLID